MVSKQWFVKMDTLAGPAIDAVENGEIKFTVSRKEGDYIPLNVLKIEEYTNVEE